MELEKGTDWGINEGVGLLMTKKASVTEVFAPLRLVRRRLWFVYVMGWFKWGIWASLGWIVAVLLLARMIPLYQAETIAWGGAALFLLIAVGVGVVRGPSWEAAANQADQCGLQERVITAWRLRHEESPLIRLQRVDAAAALHQLLPKLKEELPLFSWSRKELSICGMLLILCLTFMILPNPLAKVAREQQEIRQALAEQEKKVEEELQTLEKTPVPAEKKEEIKKALEDLVDELRTSETLEEGMEALAKSEEKLEKLKQQAEQEGMATHNLAKMMAEEPVTSKLAQAQSEGDAETRRKALHEAKAALDKLSDEEREKLAAKLKQASEEWAKSTSLSSQEVAKQLSQAAQSISSGSPQAASQLGQVMEATSKTLSGQEASNQQINQALERIEEGKSALAQADQGKTTASKGSSSSGNGSAGNQGSGGGSGAGTETGVGKDSAAGSGSSSSGRGSGSGSGHGKGEGSGQGKGAGSGAGNRELVSVPAERITGGGPQEVVSGPLGEGREQIEQGNPGSDRMGVSSPYADVYSEYAKEARQAIERGDFSLFEQLILEYFSSIEPQ